MENAVLMAAGLGMRMRPLTDRTPKPLLSVSGKPMIESVIEGLLHRGVSRVYIVTGWLGEKFSYLCNKYRDIEIIHNPDFAETNNISSVYYACDVLEIADCFLCEADLYVPDKSVFEADLLESCYFGKRVTGRCDDWIFDMDGNGIISRIGKGGRDCFQMVGVSYFKKRETAALAEKIRTAYEQGVKSLFWDEVADQNLAQLRLRIHPVLEGQIIEIDTPNELEEVNRQFSKR